MLATQIEMSEKAMAELRRLGATGPRFLRIRTVPGGCSGMTYSAEVDAALSEDDEVLYQQDDLRVVADAGSLIFLDGLQVDYSDDLVQAGFRFRNPKATKTCGCGSSFSA